MSDEGTTARIAAVWAPEAQADLRAIDRKIALEILHCIDRYLSDRAGDVKKLKPPLAGFRLRCGDYRVFFDRSVFFDQSGGEAINIIAVRHRREAYR